MKIGRRHYKLWKWLIVVILIIPPIVIIMLPTAILRILLHYLYAAVEWLDERLHDLLGLPFAAIKRWSFDHKANEEQQVKAAGQFGDEFKTNQRKESNERHRD